MKNLLILSFISILVGGCAGLKISPIPEEDLNVSASSNENLSTRHKFPVPADYSYDLDDLVGTIIYVYQDNSYNTITRLIDPKTQLNSTVPTTQEPLFYSQYTSDGQAGVTGLVNLSLSQDQACEISMKDVRQVDVQDNDDLTARIAAWGNSHPKPDGVKARYFIRQAILTSVEKKYSKQISDSGSGSISSAVGLNGKIYQSDLKSSYDLLVFYSYKDVDLIAATIPTTIQSGTTVVSPAPTPSLQQTPTSKATPSSVVALKGLDKNEYNFYKVINKSPDYKSYVLSVKNWLKKNPDIQKQMMNQIPTQNYNLLLAVTDTNKSPLLKF